MKRKWILISLIILLISVIYKRSISYNNEVYRLVPSQGIVIVSTSTGGGREIALRLADVGFHVIIGVSNSLEKSSFKYSSNKGIILYYIIR